MLIGKLNYEKISKDYTGLETETAKTIVDNEKQTIKVDVKTIDELTSLKDVSISNLQNDQILQYNKDHNIWINKDLEEITPELIKEKYESNPDTNAFTDLDKEKVDRLVIDGTGTRYLNDLGEYGEVSGGTGEELIQYEVENVRWTAPKISQLLSDKWYSHYTGTKLTVLGWDE